MSIAAETVRTSILSDAASVLGEGPTYDRRSDTAWWFDIVSHKLWEHRFRTSETIEHPLPFMGSQLAFIDDHSQLVAGENGLHVRDIATGRLTLHTPLEADNRVTRSNDGRVHPSGSLWIGTMGRNAEKEAGAIYWFGRGELRRLYAAITIPNAICFTADGTLAYFTDTAGGLLMRVAVDPLTGLPVEEPSVLYDHRGQEGGLDGAVVDAEGVIWNARWGASSIDAYAPDGRRVRTLHVPATRPSCPLFVGAGADRMLVTTARQGMKPGELEADPDAGKTFVLDFPMKGRFEPRVLLA